MAAAGDAEDSHRSMRLSLTAEVINSAGSRVFLRSGAETLWGVKYAVFR